MQNIQPTQAFIDKLSTRDFDGLAATLAPDAVARFLLPRGPEEITGAPAIARRLAGWFGAADDFIVLSTADEAIGRRRHLRWTFSLCREAEKVEVIEQAAFADAGPDGIYRLDVVCSGFLPAP
jgi:ketosteroid isomerase-like protein